MALQIGHVVSVIDAGGREVANGVITGKQFSPRDVCYEVNGRWYFDCELACVACGIDMQCPQCEVEADLSGMMFA